MSQYFLPFDSPALQADKPVNATSAAAKSRTTRDAEQCRHAAEQLQKHIEAKHKSADNSLLLPPTRRRLQVSDRLLCQAQRLEQIQSTLRKLAEMHENRTISPELTDLTSCAAVERALFQAGSQSAIQRIYREAAREEAAEVRAGRMEREALLQDIPGFFPTPREAARRLVNFALVEPDHTVLEPSAGVGWLIDAVLNEAPRARVSYCEVNFYLLDVLRLKYSEKGNVHFITRDFEELDLNEFRARFDRVIMNPPFERGRDIAHVLRAYDLLAPGGVLAAIVSEGAFSREDKKALAFRDFLSTHSAATVTLPPDSFKTSGTQVSCRLVRLRKSR